MGASFLWQKFPDCPKEALKEKFRRMQENAAYEDGHEYSGNWNMCTGLSIDETRVFASIKEAVAHLNDVCEKHGVARAVRAQTAPSVIVDQKLKEAEEQWRHVQVEVVDFDRQLLVRVREGKSRTRGCDNCGSSIAVSHLRSVYCPVCNIAFLKTPTDDKRLQALQAKVERLKKAAEVRREQLAKRQKTAPALIWVIGGLCAS